MAHFATAVDGHDAGVEQRGDLAPHGGIGLAEVLPTFAVPHDAGAHADAGQHARTDLAGEGALCGLMAVLGGHHDAGAAQLLHGIGQERVRRGHQHLHGRRPAFAMLRQRVDQVGRFRAVLVHLPVACYDRSHGRKDTRSERMKTKMRTRPRRHGR